MGNERAGKTFPEPVGGGKAILHVGGKVPDVRISLKDVLPEIMG